MQEPGGVVGDARQADTPGECFSLFISEDIVDIIPLETNKAIQRYVSTLPPEKQKLSYHHLTDNIEISAYFGLCYL